MQAAYLILSLVVATHASESTSSLVAKLQAERDRKRALINQLNVKTAIAQEERMEKEIAADKTPVIEREEMESKGVIAETQYGVEEKMLNARNKISEAEELAEKAKNMATTVEGVTTEEDKKKLSKLTFESSFLEQEARKKSMRERDSSFVQLEVDKLQTQKKEIMADLKKKADLAAQQKIGMMATAKIMKEEAQKELRTSEKEWSGVQAVVQQNEAFPKHMAPKWMIEAQLTEAMDAQTDEGRKTNREKNELKMQKSYLWKQMGKKFTCQAERNQVKAFIIESNSDRATCVEKQLEKYCMEPLRAPAVNQDVVMNLVKEQKDCLPNGVDERVPENRRASVAGKWCNFVQVLQGIAAQPLKEKYFVLLEDHVKVDPMNFEETIKSFADEYFHGWDLLQLDPMGKHNEADKMVDFAGKPVYRNSRNGQYFGMNSVLLKTESAAPILQKMMEMPAVPLDTLPTLLNEMDGKLSAASLAADIISVPKKASLLQSTKCETTQSGLLELEQMSEKAVKPAALIQTQTEPLDFFAFQTQMGQEKAFKGWENRDLTDF
jgi:hypothetical protein